MYYADESLNIPLFPLDNQIREISNDEYTECAYERFWQEEQKKPAHLRFGACMLVCNCRRCRESVIC